MTAPVTTAIPLSDRRRWRLFVLIVSRTSEQTLRIPVAPLQRTHGHAYHDAGMDDEQATCRRRLLVASPELEEPNFRRTVVYVLAHDDDGALGVVVNRPGKLPAAAALPNWAEHAAEPALLFQGGPVEPGGVIGLGRSPDGAVVPLDLSEQPSDVGAAGPVRLFAGYAGWGAGQLDHELAMSGWIVVDACADDVSSDEPAQLWWTVLRRQRGTLSWLGEFPDDLRVN